MLTLHRNSRTIVTDESFSVKLKWVNPACYMDAIPGDVGLGLEISVNEYTRAEFGNPGRFEKYVTGQDRKFPGVSVRFNGALLMSGTLVITNANRETYSGWLQSELGALGTAQRDKFITEMEWKTDVTFADKSIYDPEDGDEYACLEVKNPTFWEGKGKDTTITVNFNDENGDPQTKQETANYLTNKFRLQEGFIVNARVDGLIDVTGDACVVSPYLFLNVVITELFRKNNFFVDQENNPLNDLPFQLLVYNNFNIFKQVFTTDVTTIPSWDETTQEYVTIPINEVKTMNLTIDTFNYADLIPRIALKDFVLFLQNFLNIIFHFRSDNTLKLINRNDIPNAKAYSLDAYFLDFWEIGERKDVTLKFIQELEKDDELVSADWHDLSERRADYKDPVDTIDELKALPSPAFGELRLVKSENKIYEYKWQVFTATDDNLIDIQTDVLQWTFASNYPQPFFYGTSDIIEKIKTGCSTLFLNPTTGVNETKQRGNLGTARSLWADFSFRLLGYDAGSAHSLAFDGDNGLFATNWKKWANFWKNRLQVKGEFMIPANELYYIINNITQPYSTRAGKFLIEEMECDFQGTQMSTVKITGYKLD